MYSVLWWLLIVVSSLFISFSVERKERGLWAAITLGASLILISCFSSTPILAWISENPWRLGYAVVGYFLAGAVWGVIKWIIFNLNRRWKYDLERSDLMHERGISDITSDKAVDEWSSYLRDSDYWSYSPSGMHNKKDRIIQVKIPARRCLDRIGMWMTFWPWSLAWTAFYDVIRTGFRQIQRLLNGLMDRITVMIFRGTDGDYK
jgi:MFS family permease